jgi:hypothetical protein
VASWIDASLYPDEEPPEALEGPAQRVDFVARLCSAWDFGILPEEDAVIEVCRDSWRDAVEACRLLTSPAYHLLRRMHGLPEAPYLGQSLAYIREDPNLPFV